MEQATGQYQVFINHRGPDTKNNLASLLYHGLISYGLYVFLDDEELYRGDTVYPEIREAISSASVHVVIFSPRYAESRWCLNELRWMMRSCLDRKVIIPVFCDVEPADLDHIDNGCYAKAFDKHQREGKVSMEIVEEWEKALKKASKIKGLSFKKKESDYGEFVRNIESMIIKHVKWDPLEVAPYPVGLDEALADLDYHIRKQSSTIAVGIVGDGGIGKSTLAKHIFQLRRSEFGRACFLCNVREKVDLTFLQRQLLRDLLGKDIEIPNTHIGKSILRNSLKGLTFLIILDDVDDRNKIKSVLDMNAVESGSLVFITSRDKDILSVSSANSFVYEVKPLNRNHALELFCRHAFYQSNPFEDFEELVEEFLNICGGLPLCLKFWGEQLAGKLDRTYWKLQLENLSRLPLTKADTVIHTLKWGYKAMEIEQQEMLLDVACFFVGEDLELAVRVLEGLGYCNDVRKCLESLRQKCLVDFNNDMECQNGIGPQVQDVAILEGSHLILPAVLSQRSSTITMQNEVREMARRIVREELRTMEKPLRLSCSTDIEKMKMFQLQSGSVFCRGIVMRKGRSPPQFPNNVNIRGVRLLVVEHHIDSSWFLRSSISGDLVWLRWRNSPFISLPRTILLRNLRVLELQAPKGYLLEELFDFIIDEMPSQLLELNLDMREESPSSSTWSRTQPVDHQHSAKSFDGSISTAGQGGMPSFSRFLQSIGSSMKNLNKIVLKNVTVLQSLPFDCSELKSLRHLDLSGSTNLTTLPNSFSQLLQLQHLALRDCINLSIPVETLGEISTLEHIDLKGCAKLLHLPQGIACQRRLRYLNLLHTSLLELPLTLEPLYELEQLRIGSGRLTELPDCMVHFVHLKELILVKCINLKYISTPIEHLTFLERLEIYGSKVPILPAGIALLKHLKFLTIHSCPIEKIVFHNSVMEALTDLTLLHTSISDISIPAGACPRLEIVDLSYNLQLRQIKIFESALVKLNLDGCSSLEHLKVIQLKFLNMSGCGNIRTLDVENWRSFEEITAERCWNLWITEEEWSQLERLNFFSFSQRFLFNAVVSGRRMDRAEHVMEFDTFLRKSFDDATKLEVPTTATPTSPFLLKNVYSHCAILMCFLTTDNGGKFKVRFEACNRGAHSDVYETAGGDGVGGLVVNVYMWTHDARLFKDDDNFYDDICIYKEGKFDVEGGERGLMLMFSRENHVLNICKQIMQYMSAKNMGEFLGSPHSSLPTPSSLTTYK